MLTKQNNKGQQRTLAKAKLHGKLQTYKGKSYRDKNILAVLALRLYVDKFNIERFTEMKRSNKENKKL